MDGCSWVFHKEKCYIVQGTIQQFLGGMGWVVVPQRKMLYSTWYYIAIFGSDGVGGCLAKKNAI